MPWQVKRNEELGFIEVAYTGSVTINEVQEATTEALSLATGIGPHFFLADLSDALSRLSVRDIYAMPEQWEAARATRSNRLACVVPQGAVPAEDLRFYENVTHNRGWKVQVFEARAAAVNWLVTP